MKILLLLVIFFFASKNIVFAHGGFEKQAGNIKVYVLQNPISPVVGEKVTMSFKMTDESVQSKDISKKNLVNFPVDLKVIDTYYGNAINDKVIDRQNIKTDSNGNFSFEYTFNKENYFDVDLDFIDRNGEQHEVGFLIQTRSKNRSPFIPTGDKKKYLENNEAKIFYGDKSQSDLILTIFRFIFGF